MNRYLISQSSHELPVQNCWQCVKRKNMQVNIKEYLVNWSKQNSK